MAGMTNYEENRLLDHIFRGTAYAQEATHYIALFTSDPTDTGSQAGEVSGGSYARVAVTRGDAQWKGTHGSSTGVSSGTNGTILNAAAITFPAPTANWGTITHIGICDAASAGNMLYYSALQTSKTVNNGDDAPSFAIDALSIQLDN